MTWQKSALFKLSKGAIVLLPTSKGKFLLERNGPESRNPGMLRPPGGSRNPEDKDQTDTIIREIGEEFAIPADEVKKHLRFLGYTHQREFWGTAVFEFKNHGLKPGKYQASNDPDETVTLEEHSLEHPDYVGPMPHKLITEAARDIGNKLIKNASLIMNPDSFLTRNVTDNDCDALAQLIVTIEDDCQANGIQVKSARFHMPENFDKETKLSTAEYTVYLGANDWENRTSAMAVLFRHGSDGLSKRVWVELKTDKDDSSDNWDGEFGRSLCRKWIALAREERDKRSEGSFTSRLRPEDFLAAAKQLTEASDYGIERSEWLDLDKSASVTAPSAVPETPVTGPEAIAFAVENIDLDAKEKEAHDILNRKLKSKRPDAVRTLGYIQGFRRAGMHPKDLLISKVPVIPPAFRPYTAAGDTFVPGDANELYRDLINIRDMHPQLEARLGAKGAASNKLRIHDAVSALYGYTDPVVPKTKERGVSGFLKKLTGSNPKFSFPQRKLLSKDVDFSGRGVIGIDPELGLNEIGIPDEMAWTLYSPYVIRRLVRSGMSPADALRHTKERSDMATRMLDGEIKDRPVVYSRAPAWHKYNSIGGYVKRVPGSVIKINPLVGTGLNADHDGDTINIHLPSLPDAVKDVKEKLMPDKMLFSIKDREKVVPTLKQDFVLGLYTAQKRPAKQTWNFPTQAEALKAIQSGQVRLSDEVTIGQPKVV